MARNDDGPRLEARGQTPNQQQSSAHESDMYALATRIRWLEHHRHWWIRSIRERQWSR
jgi:hypothetical protein